MPLVPLSLRLSSLSSSNPGGVSMVDVTAASALIGGAGAAVGAVGAAVTGVRALTASFKHYREVMGYSVGASMRQARKDASESSVSASGRQMEKEYEQMWAEQAAEDADPWEGYTAADDARDRAAAGLPPR